MVSEMLHAKIQREGMRTVHKQCDTLKFYLVFHIII